MREPLTQAVWRRGRLLLLGQFIGWVVTTLVALWLSGPSFAGFGMTWGMVAGGPLTRLGAASPLCGIPTQFWWMTALLIPAHPLSPSRGMGVLTLFGLACWYFQGAVSALIHWVI